MPMREEQIETSADSQIEHGNTRCPAEVHMPDPVMIPVHRKLAHPDEFRIQRQHSALREVDTPCLLVVHRLTADVVTVRIQYRRHLSPQVRRLIEQGRYPHSRIPLKPHFPDPIPTSGFDHISPYNLRL